ncbi:MAG: hypothetical protein LBQ88_19135, partial [Treponema sp.]|nr:hypothetical protein [Treponema sp.]
NLNVEDINPAELKFDLIKDPQRKAKFKIGLLKEEINNKVRLEGTRYDVLYKDSQLLEESKKQIIPLTRSVMESEAAMKGAKEKLDSLKKGYEKAKKDKDKSDESLEAISDYEEAEWQYKQKQTYYKSYKKSAKEVQDAIEAITQKMNKLDLQTPAQVEIKLKEYTAEIQRLKKESEKLDKEFDRYVADAKREIELSKKKVPPLSEQIENNVRSIMGDLRPMDEVEKEIRAEREKSVKKAFAVVSKRFLRIRGIRGIQ